MNDNDIPFEVARQRLAEKRAQVRTAPASQNAQAPEWLHSVEDLHDFFNETAEVWDAVFAPSDEDTLYEAVAAQITPAQDEKQVLVLGCGTGMELMEIFTRLPHMRVTGIDLAPNMLRELRRKYADRLAQITLIEGSYLDIPLGAQQYDYVVATLTAHHLAPETKVVLYQRIRQALKLGGRYIEGDQSTSLAHEQEVVLYWYYEYIAKLPGGDHAQWNYDVTLSPETQRKLLHQAGFGNISMPWEKQSEGVTVFVAW